VLVAVMADSHDNLPALRAAVAVLKNASVSAIIHCGDIVAPFSLRILTDTGIPTYAVFGNNDGERRILKKELPTIQDPPLTISLAGKKITLYHAPPEKTPATDILLYGHTHKREMRRDRGVFILNPGELGGWLTGRCSFAILDLRTSEVQWVDF